MLSVKNVKLRVYWSLPNDQITYGYLNRSDVKYILIESRIKHIEEAIKDLTKGENRFENKQSWCEIMYYFPCSLFPGIIFHTFLKYKC